jgi:site-specific recombinase XerD
MDDPLYSMKREMLRRRMSNKTVKTYLLYVKKFLLKNEDVPIKKLSKKQVRDYLYYLQDKGVSGSTMNVAHNALRFFMIEILHKGMYLKIKFSKVPKKKVACLTREEVMHLIESISNAKHRLLISLMYGAGLRVSEVVKLKREHLDFENLVGWVIEGKGKKDRPKHR